MECMQRKRDIFIDSLLVRVHLIIEMSRSALRHWSLNSLFQVALYLPSYPKPSPLLCVHQNPCTFVPFAHDCRRWSWNPSGKTSQERLTRNKVISPYALGQHVLRVEGLRGRGVTPPLFPPFIPHSPPPERELFIHNLLVRIRFIIEIIWWTGLAPWESLGP